MSDLNLVIKLLLHYKYLILFPIAVIEGPIISIISGFLSSEGYLSLPLTYIVLILADLTGDTLYYAIGRYGGRPFIEHWGKYLGINSSSKLAAAEKHFQEHPKKTLFFVKTQVWGALVLAAAGLAKMPFGDFIWINLLATTIKSFVFLIIGFYFGKLYSVFNLYINDIGIVLSLIGIIIVVYFFKKTGQKK